MCPARRADSSTVPRVAVMACISPITISGWIGNSVIPARLEMPGALQRRLRVQSVVVAANNSQIIAMGGRIAHGLVRRHVQLAPRVLRVALLQMVCVRGTIFALHAAAHVCPARGHVELEGEDDGLNGLDRVDGVEVGAYAEKAPLVARSVSWGGIDVVSAGLEGVRATDDVEPVGVGPVEEDGERDHDE